MNVVPGSGTRIAIDGIGGRSVGSHGGGISQPISSAGGATSPPQTALGELGVPVSRVGVAHHRREMLDPGSADGGACVSGLAAHADHSQRVLICAERELVPDARAHTGTALSRGTRSHSSSRDVKYQPPRS